MHELPEAVWLSLWDARRPQHLVLAGHDRLQRDGQLLDQERDPSDEELHGRHKSLHDCLWNLYRCKLKV